MGRRDQERRPVWVWRTAWFHILVPVAFQNTAVWVWAGVRAALWSFPSVLVSANSRA
jgi:hypothetical protein